MKATAMFRMVTPIITAIVVHLYHVLFANVPSDVGLMNGLVRVERKVEATVSTMDTATTNSITKNAMLKEASSNLLHLETKHLIHLFFGHHHLQEEFATESSAHPFD